MKKNKIFPLILLVPILILLTYLIIYDSYYLNIVQKKLAEENFQKYIAEQNISPNNIQSKVFITDYEQGGHIIKIIYKNDPANIYEYMYSPIRKSSPYHICLIIYTKKYHETNTYKYQPLD